MSGSGRRRIGIEAFLKWAYRDELPKDQALDGPLDAPREYGSAWGGITAYAEVGALVDYARENRWGVIPDRYALDGAHSDAIRAALAMETLDGLELALPDDWNPIADLGEIGQIHRRDSAAAALGRAKVAEALDDLTSVNAAGERVLKGSLRRLVMRFAVLGGEPGWEIEPPTAGFVMAGKGRPAWFRREVVQGERGAYEVEVDGFDRKARRPYGDAYQRRVLTPDPLEGIIERGLHEVYVAALHHLHGELVDNLTRYALEPTARPAQPWDAGAPARPRLLRAKPLPALADRPDGTPMPETPHAAPTGLKVALGRLPSKKIPLTAYLQA